MEIKRDASITILCQEMLFDSIDSNELKVITGETIEVEISPYSFVPQSIGDLWPPIYAYISNSLLPDLINGTFIWMLASIGKWLIGKIKQTKKAVKISPANQACIKIGDVQILLPEDASAEELLRYLNMSMTLMKNNPEPTPTHKKTIAIDADSNKVVLMDADDFAWKYIYHSSPEYPPIEEENGVTWPRAIIKPVAETDFIKVIAPSPVEKSPDKDDQA